MTDKKDVLDDLFLERSIIVLRKEDVEKIAKLFENHKESILDLYSEIDQLKKEFARLKDGDEKK